MTIRNLGEFCLGDGLIEKLYRAIYQRFYIRKPKMEIIHMSNGECVLHIFGQAFPMECGPMYELEVVATDEEEKGLQQAILALTNSRSNDRIIKKRP